MPRKKSSKGHIPSAPCDRNLAGEPEAAKVGYITVDGHKITIVMLPPDGEEAVNRRLRTILELAIAIGRRQGRIRSNIGNSKPMSEKAKEEK
ncbi:MAG: hypothetical protein FJZ94_07995 [Chloroflexi bacterium]|nr:hypothetical protein [Chloroflexota bacterium]